MEYQIIEDSNLKLKENMLGNSIDLFIKRQVQYYRNLNTNNDNNKILRLRYEDIILNYNILNYIEL